MPIWIILLNSLTWFCLLATSNRTLISGTSRYPPHFCTLCYLRYWPITTIPRRWATTLRKLISTLCLTSSKPCICSMKKVIPCNKLDQFWWNSTECKLLSKWIKVLFKNSIKIILNRLFWLFEILWIFLNMISNFN